MASRERRGSAGRQRGVVLAVLAVLLASGAIAIVQGYPTAAGAAAVLVSDSSLASQELAQASASLAAGQGPAGGQSVACSSTGSATSDSCSLATAAVAVNTTAFWNSEVTPGARTGAAMTYDGKDRYVLLFGGWNGTSGYLGDTWEFLHSQWINLPMKAAPSARANASIAYDSKDKYVVLFGGQNTGGLLGDTWTYATGVWTQLSPASPPSPRIDAAMTFDTRDSYLVLFGGSSGGGPLGDTWSFVGGTWNPLSPTSSPSARAGAAMAFDAADNYVVLFGGVASGTVLGDTWEFQTGQWTHLTPTSSPAARTGASFVFDANTAVNYLVLYGGLTTTGGPADLGDTWDFIGGDWNPLPQTTAPEARQDAASSYDASDTSILLFSGSTDGDPLTATDTWEFQFNATTHAIGWVQLVQESAASIEEPSARYGAAMASDGGTNNGILMFGGTTGNGPSGQTWQFTVPGALKTNNWYELFPSPAPSARTYAAMTWDGRDSYVVLFGGMTSAGTALGDTWEFQSGKWTQLSPSTPPPARYGAMMAYDQIDGYVVLFGGTNGSQYFSDTWTFAGGQWTKLSIASPPPGVAFGGLAWDPHTNYTVLFGGTTGSSASASPWKFLAGAWTLLTPKQPVAPPAEWGMVFVNDPKDQYIYLFGGCTTASFNPMSPSCPSADVLSGTWKFRGNFTLLATTGHNQAPPDAVPGARYLASGAFEMSPTALKLGAPYVLLEDGLSGKGKILQERWGYVASIYSLWSPDPIPEARYGQQETQDIRDQQALVFGGIGQVGGGGLGYLNDTWLWDTGIWGATSSAKNPSARAFGTMTSWYPGLTKFQMECLSTCFTVLFGGVGPSGYLNDTWKWVGSPFGGHWTAISSARAPLPRANATMTFDVADGYILLFGGQNGNTVFDDTWTWTPTAGWTQLHPTNAPPAREGQVMVYDSEDHYVLLFGGQDGSTYYGDTWSFVGGVWTQLHPTGAPQARVGAGMYDSPKPAGYGFVLMIGGYNGSSFLGDTWAYLGGTWTLIPAKPAGVVPYAWGGIDDDVDDGHPNIFGGLTAGGIVSDFWEFKKGP